jgi:hypothetical protein
VTRYPINRTPGQALRTRAGAALACLTLFIAAPGGHAADLRVPDQYPSIQAAINAALPGDTVVVAPGLYTENLQLRSSIDVRGEEAALTLLRADSLTQPAVRIAGVTDVLFGNFTLLDSDDGIHVINSDDIIIANNIFDTLDGFAVDVDTPSVVDIFHNVFYDNVVAVRRGSISTWIVNNIFYRNVSTITSSAFADLHAEVRFNCFHDNDDLRQGGVHQALGTDFQIGDPLFVDIGAGDFHLRLGSPCIDNGEGTDAIDGTQADIGAYGGPFADPWPFPVPQPVATDTSAGSDGPFNITLSWEPNLDYRVTNPANPGSYRIYYQLNASGPPYDGTDAGTDTLPSPIEVGDDTVFELTDLNPVAVIPQAPQQVAVDPRNQGAVIEWNPVSGAIGYRVYYGIDAVTENMVQVGDVDRYTVTGLTNNTQYRFAVAALNRATYFLAVTVLDNTADRHESLFSAEETVQVGPAAESPLSVQVTATPNPTLPQPGLPDGDRCFIATAAFGSPHAPAVLVLRDLRDRYLNSNPLGRELTALYYRISPRVATLIDEHPWLRVPVQVLLLPFVTLSLLLLGSSLSTKFALLALLLLALARRSGWRSRAALAALLATPAAQAADDRHMFTDRPVSRWTVDMQAGRFEPDVADYARFYGDEHSRQLGLGFGWRFRHWLEFGGSVGHSRDSGVGLLPDGSLGGDVRYVVMPAQAFVSVRWDRGGYPLLVPYLSAGLVRAYYSQRVDLQPRRRGRTELGTGLSAGLQLSLDRLDPRNEARYGRSPLKRSFVLLQMQRFSTKVEDVELGGDVYSLGFRFEFGRRDVNGSISTRR